MSPRADDPGRSPAAAPTAPGGDTPAPGAADGRGRVVRLAESLLRAATRLDDEDLERAARALLAVAAPKAGPAGGHGAGGGRVLVTGAGRFGLVAQMFANRLLHLGLPVHVVGEVTCPPAAAGDLLVLVSNSGTTPWPLQAARTTAGIGGSLLAVTGHPVELPGPGTLVVLPVDDDPHQPMGSGFEQSALLFCDALVLRLAELLGADEESMRARHANLE